MYVEKLITKILDTQDLCLEDIATISRWRTAIKILFPWFTYIYFMHIGVILSNVHLLTYLFTSNIAT
jgi:hypothetical protein